MVVGVEVIKLVGVACVNSGVPVTCGLVPGVITTLVCLGKLAGLFLSDTCG